MFGLEHWIGFVVAAAIPAVVFAVWTKRTYFSDSVDDERHAPIYAASNAHPTIDFSPEGLLLDMKDKWTRPLTKLPVNVDIPRLARKMSIYDETGELLLDGGWLDLTPEECE